MTNVTALTEPYVAATAAASNPDKYLLNTAYPKSGMTTASAMADPKLVATSRVKPECAKANPPFNPNAINRYNDKKREIADGISRLDLTLAANTPNTKNKIAGSRNTCIAWPPDTHPKQKYTSCKIKFYSYVYR